MSAKNIVGIVIILGCLITAGVVFSGKAAQRAEVQRQDALHEQRLDAAYRFVESLPLDPDQLGRMRAWVPLAHDRSFIDAYDDDASPRLDETLYMASFVGELLASAIHEEDVPLIRYCQSLVEQYPLPSPPD